VLDVMVYHFLFDIRRGGDGKGIDYPCPPPCLLTSRQSELIYRGKQPHAELYRLDQVKLNKYHELREYAISTLWARLVEG
jgi:hypothetical protein